MLCRSVEFERVLADVTALLESEHRLAYRGLKRRFQLSDDDLEDLKAELIDAKQIAADEAGRVLVWCGQRAMAAATPAPASYTPEHLAQRIRAGFDGNVFRASGAGERKTITILFADLKGSTALIEGLDPEEARAILDPALRIMMDAVHRYEGYVAQALGDGILALFGAPLAHEDHAMRAVYAALRMQDELARYSDHVRLDHGAPLALRVGINTGEVVLRSIHKDDLHADYIPVGHSINLAARMEQMATPGAVLITGYTQKLVDGFFKLRALGAAAIKGVAEPLQVFEVVGTGPLRTRLQVAARRGLTPFVGRQAELAALCRALDLARDGHGQVVGVMGEPGMGKSRLVHEFKLAAQSDFAVFEAYSSSYGKASPYLPLIELLKDYFAIRPDDVEQTRREKIIGRLLGLDRTLDGELPYYFALLNVSDPDSTLAAMDPKVRRRRTFEALKRVTLRASLERPLLLVFEDLHWIDGETQGALDHLVEGIASARILLLTNYRPEYQLEWGNKTYYTQIKLASLGRAEAEALLTTLTGEPATPAASAPLATLRASILDRTAGTPFFMEEVVQAMFEEGALVRDASGRISLRAGTPGVREIPATVQGVLGARIDRLTAEEKALLQQLAVIGREFPLGLAEAVVGLAEDRIHPLLEALQRKEFVYEQPAYPEIDYVFKHALTQEVAYNSLLSDRRKDIHERTARAIETRHAAAIEDHYGALAHHYSRSENIDKAIEYLELAGLQAIERSAVADATGYLRTALSLLEKIPDSADRGTRELRLLLALAGPLRMMEGMASLAHAAICTRARDLCISCGNAEDLFRVLVELRLHYCVRGDSAAALGYAEELAALATQHDDPWFDAQAQCALALSRFALGEFDATLAHAERVRETYTSDQQPIHVMRFGMDPCLMSTCYEALSLHIRGYPDQALRRLAESLAMAERSQHPYMRAFPRLFAGMLHMFRREAEATARNAEVAIAIALDYGFPDVLTWGNILFGWATAQDEVGARADAIADGIANCMASGGELAVPLWEAMHAEARLTRGERAHARSAIVAGLATVARNGETFCAAELYRLRGDLASSEAVPDGARSRLAETSYLEAIELARRQSARSFELRATLSLARLWHAHDRTDEARNWLSAVYQLFTEGFDTADLRDAAAFLEQWRSQSESLPPTGQPRLPAS